MRELDYFIETRCHLSDTRTKFVDFVGAFRASLTVAENKRYPRGKLLAALRERFAVGKDNHNVIFIGGLGIGPPEVYSVVDGRLRRVPAPKPEVVEPKLILGIPLEIKI